MGFLRSLFGPSKAEIWRQIAERIGGQFDEGGFFGRDVLRFQSGEWEISLDTYTVQSGGQHPHSQTFTRMRAPFVNKDGLYLKIYREGFFSALGKTFGMQDIEIGDSYFDPEFIIKSNDETKIRQFLDSKDLKELIGAQPQFSLEIKDDEGFFGKKFPDGVDQLQFICGGVIKDPDRIQGLFALFSCALERLVQIDSAYEDDPDMTL